MKRFFKNTAGLFKETFKEFAKDDTGFLGASLSYYTVFSMVPVLVIVISVAGLIFGREAVSGQIYGQIKNLIGPDSALQIQQMIQTASSPKTSWWATALGIVLLIFGATTVFYQLQSSLNKIWEVKAKPKKGIVKYIKDRFLSFSLIIAIGFLLLVSLVLNAALAALSAYLKARMPDYLVELFKVIDILVSFGIVTLLFALIYRYLPDAIVRWRDVWIGAAFTAFLFTLGHFAIGYYLGKANIGSTFGAAGSIVLVLVWVNYSSQILFFGAEFTQVYAQKYGQIIIPAEYAVRISTVEVEQKDNESTAKFEQKVDKVKETCETESDKIPDSHLEKEEKKKKEES